MIRRPRYDSHNFQRCGDLPHQATRAARPAARRRSSARCSTCGRSAGGASAGVGDGWAVKANPHRPKPVRSQAARCLAYNLV